MDFKIASEAKIYLLGEARKSIYNYLGIDLKNNAENYSGEDIKYKCGAFVTLHKNGSLRGCIGNMASNHPLLDTVRSMALAAAFNDPRFTPVTKEELSQIDIEITALSPLEETSYDDIKVGRDGLYVQFMGRSGVLLPQVAVEYGWDRNEFLYHLMLKAGLPADTWQRNKINLYRFEGIVFGEKDL